MSLPIPCERLLDHIIVADRHSPVVISISLSARPSSIRSANALRIVLLDAQNPRIHIPLFQIGMYRIDTAVADLARRKILPDGNQFVSGAPAVLL